MMSLDRGNTLENPTDDTRFFDGFTRTMLAVMGVLLLFIFISGKYMSAHQMEAGGTDDKVNTLATDVTRGEHHPFIELPGDAQVGAFSVANFFAGLIVGYHWLRLFGGRKPGREGDAAGRNAARKPEEDA